MRGCGSANVRIPGLAAALAVAMLGGLDPRLVAQDQAEARFDAASIKPNRSRSGDIDAHSTGNQLRAINVSLLWLVRDAYQLQDFQVVGVPEWAANQRFDVTARADRGLGDQYRPMLRTLLAERFGLVAQRDTRELPIYMLVPARQGRLGPRLASSRFPSCEEAERAGQFCGFDLSNRSLRAGAVTMPELAAKISEFVGRIVVDRTGLAGAFDASLEWTSDARRPPAAGDDGPSIFTALQEQLGLKLDAQKGPVEVLVIDRVEQPTAD